MKPWKWRSSAADYLGLGLSAVVVSFTSEITGWRLWVGGALVFLEVSIFFAGRLEKSLARRELRITPEFEHWMNLLRSKDEGADQKQKFALDQARKLLSHKYSAEAVDTVVKELTEKSTP